MQRSDAAARRFFGAFYRWTRLTSSAHGASARSVEQRTCHAAHRRLRNTSCAAETKRTFSSQKEQCTVTNHPVEERTSTSSPCSASLRHGQKAFDRKERDKQDGFGLAEADSHARPFETPSACMHSRTRRHLDNIKSNTIRHCAQEHFTTTKHSSPSLSNQTRNSLSKRHYYSTAAKHSHTNATDLSNPSANLGENVRAALRLLTHPVTLITTSDPSQDLQRSDDKLFSCRGVTVSSFSTVTLNPSAVVSFNLKIPSRSWDAISHSEQLRVHLLAATPEGASIAHTFTQPYQAAHEPFHRLADRGISLQTRDPDFPPLIGPTEGVLAHMSARVIQDKCVQVGDHVIVVAEVLDCEFFPQGTRKGAVELTNALDNATGLAYAAQRYRVQGDHIDLQDSPNPSNASNDKHAKSLHNDSKSAGLDKRSSSPSSGISMQSGGSVQTGGSSLQQARSYSTTPTPDEKHDSNAILEPAARDTTVADFFNLPDEDDPRSRFPNINKLLVVEKTIKRARQQLEDGVAEGLPLSDSKMSKLEKKIAHDERRVAKKLSKYAARSLRVMLDKGRVDFKRAQWLESCIERGQAALTSDIEEVEGMFRQGSLDEETFRIASEKLQSDYDALVTEAMRLRQIVDEENDSPALDPDNDRAQGQR